MIRLQRVGRKNIPTFRVVLTDSRNSAKSGKYLEALGSYDPVHKVKEVNAERVRYWISKGAKPSETLHNLLVAQKIIEGKKVNVLPMKKKTLKRKELKAKAGGKKTAAPTAPVAPAVSAAEAAPKVEARMPGAAVAEPKETPAEATKTN
jgi:small subunit ribosomal protein S16